MVGGEVLPEAVAALARRGHPMGIDLHALRCFAPDGTVRLGSATESGLDFAHFDTVKGSIEEVQAFDPAAADVRDGLHAIARRGVRAVFATDGSRGALLPSDGVLREVPPFPVTEVDATGAGDVFLAAFLFARHARGEAPEDAARFAAAAASFVVEGAGATVLGNLAAVEARRSRLGA
jgi:sugar/nucleoside kinase (ribokinase family)